MSIDVLSLPYPERIVRLGAAANEEEERELLCLIMDSVFHPCTPSSLMRERKTFANILGILKWPANVMVLWERVGRGFIDDEFRKCPILPDELQAFLGMVEEPSKTRTVEFADGSQVHIADWAYQPLYSKAKRVKR